ncbi:MAG: LexA family protein [Ruminiclostridium sp.]
MSKFSERLKELRTSRKLSQQELADKLGTSKSSVNMYERGEREPGLEMLETIADFFNVDMDYLHGKSKIANKSLEAMGLMDEEGIFTKFDNVSPIRTQRIPLLGEIACGKPIFCEEDRESYVEVGTDIRADFCLRAKGDSMINARICDGDIVFIREQPMVENGEIAAVIIEDEATLKRVYYDRDNGKLVLQAENPKYSPLVYVGEELNSIRILGKAIAFESNL